MLTGAKIHQLLNKYKAAAEAADKAAAEAADESKALMAMIDEWAAAELIVADAAYAPDDRYRRHDGTWRWDFAPTAVDERKKREAWEAAFVCWFSRECAAFHKASGDSADNDADDADDADM